MDYAPQKLLSLSLSPSLSLCVCVCVCVSYVVYVCGIGYHVWLERSLKLEPE